MARKLGLPSAGLPVDRRIDNLMAILLDATRNHAEPLTPERLWGWQASLFPTGYSGLYKVQAGSWRKSPEAMRVVSGPLGKGNNPLRSAARRQNGLGNEPLSSLVGRESRRFGGHSQGGHCPFFVCSHSSV